MPDSVLSVGLLGDAFPREEGRVRQYSYAPALITEQEEPVFLPTEEASAVLDRASAMSKPFGTRFRVEADEVVIETA